MSEINRKSIHANIKSSILLINDPSGSLFYSLYGSILYAISDEYRSGFKENKYIDRLGVIKNLLLDLSIVELNNNTFTKSTIDFINDNDYTKLNVLANIENLTINVLFKEKDSYQLATIGHNLVDGSEQRRIIILHTYDKVVYELVAEKKPCLLYTSPSPRDRS